MERYENYKDSGVEWIGEIPAYWQVMPIRALATYNDETLPEATDPEYRFDYIDISSVSEGSIDSHSEQVFSSAPSRARRIVRRRDVLVSTVRTYLKAIALVDEKHDGQIASTGFCVLRPKSDTNSRWFGYALSEESVIDEIVARSVGVSYPAINASDLVRLQLRCPPIEEQRAIADYLDAKTAEIDALVADCEREVGLLREYRKAVISQAVTKGLDPDAPMRDSGVEWIGEIPEGWLCANLSKVIKSIQTGPFGSQLHAEDYSDDGEICVVNPANLIGGRIVTASCSRISKILASSLSQHLMHVGEIVFGRRGEMGRCALVEEDGLFCGTGSIELELLDSVLPSFAVYYLQCDFVKSYLELRSVGTTLQNLNTGIIATIPFVLAPIEEQKAIVSYLDAKTAEIDSLSEAKQSMADKLREYRKSLISEAVTGKFKVPGA